LNAEDEASFERYVRERGTALSRTAIFLVGDVHLGEDLVQEVLSRLAPRWKSVSRADNLDGYVHRALVNTATSWRRRRSWQERPSDAIPETGATDDLYDDTVLRALRALPPRQRAVVVMRHYADRTEQQTADLMGCSVGTVKSTHAKAVAKLRLLLIEERA
jgi:RNA polymerase sigma-70 factor (sigma-E family)